MARGPKHSGNDQPGSGYVAPDHDLWVKVAQSVTPMDQARADGLNALRQSLPVAENKPAELKNGKALPSAPPVLPRSVPAPLKPAVPAIGQFDRRTKQKLTRGNVEIEARLDLHGHTAAQSHGELLNFLSGARARGLRTVLVITGKGCSPYARHTLHGSDHFHTPERQGRLRRLIPEWLNETMFRVHVSGFQPAHPRHGGGGAFYVRLRRQR